MAIGTDALIDFFGTQDSVDSTSSAVNDGAFSVAADAAAWTNDDDAELASFVLKFQYPSGTIDTNGIQLFARLMNIDGTSDEPTPDSNWENHYLGTFPTDAGLAALTDHVLSLGHDVELPNMYTSQVYEFYIKNDCGVQMTAGWTLKITPKAKAPHA